ncbi:MAG: copper resistance protein CopC [Pseudohongiellaceae bacterium]
MNTTYSTNLKTSSLAAILSLLWCLNATAQHSHGILTPGVTFPKDDSVLNDSPRMITMSFRVDVKLLKLALFTDEGAWINIGFQYDPARLSHSFVYPIQGDLPEADFYVARWSVTDNERRLLNGEFKFSFGPGAIPPSEIIESRVSNKEEVLPSTGAYRTGTQE